MNAQEMIQALLDAGFNLKQVADETGVNSSTIGRVYKGQTQRPHPSTIAALRTIINKQKTGATHVKKNS